MYLKLLPCPISYNPQTCVNNSYSQTVLPTYIQIISPDTDFINGQITLTGPLLLHTAIIYSYRTAGHPLTKSITHFLSVISLPNYV